MSDFQLYISKWNQIQVNGVENLLTPDRQSKPRFDGF